MAIKDLAAKRKVYQRTFLACDCSRNYYFVGFDSFPVEIPEGCFGDEGDEIDIF